MRHQRTRTIRRRRFLRLHLETLERRDLLTADITSLDVAAGTATFTGDGGNDDLVLSTQDLGPPFNQSVLAHNLDASNSTGDYLDATDFDSAAGPSIHLPVGNGSNPLITFDLGGGDDRLTIDESVNSILDSHPVAFDGGDDGANGDTLILPDRSADWQITGDNAGFVDNPSVLAFVNVENLVGSSFDDQFTVAATGSISGTIDGGGQDLFGDILIVDAQGGAVTLNVVHQGNGVFSGVVQVETGNMQTVAFDNMEDFDFLNLPPGGLDIIFSGGDGSADGNPDDATVVRSGNDFLILIDAAVVLRVPFAAINSLDVTGTAGDDDSLTLDFTGTSGTEDLIPPGGLVARGNGAADLDTLTIDNVPFLLDSVDYLATGAGSGRLQLDSSTIDFEGGEKVSVNATAIAVSVEVDDTSDHTWTFSSTVDDPNLVSFDGDLVPLAFSNPGRELVVRGDNDNNDVIAFDGFDPDFTAAVIADGRGGSMDAIAVNTNLAIEALSAAGSLALTAEQILLNGNIRTVGSEFGGAVSLTGAVSVAGDVMIDTDGSTADGEVLFDGTVDGPGSLSIMAGSANVDLRQNAGSSSPLGSFAITSANNVDLADVLADGAIDVTGSVIRANGSSYESMMQSVRFNGDVILTTPSASVAVTAGATGPQAVAFLGNVEGPGRLALTASQGDISVAGTIGQATSVGGVLIVAAMNSQFDDDISLSGSFRQFCGSSTVFNGGLDTGSNEIVLITDEVDLLGGDNSVFGFSFTVGGCAAQTLVVGVPIESGLSALEFSDADIAALAGGLDRIFLGDPSQGMNMIVIDPSGASFGDSVTLTTSDDIVINGNLDTLADGDAADIELRLADPMLPGTTVLSADVVTAGGMVMVSDSLLIDGIRRIDTTAGDTAAAGPVIFSSGRGSIFIDGFNDGGDDQLIVDAAFGAVDGTDDADIDFFAEVEGQSGPQSLPMGQDLERLRLEGKNITLGSVVVTESLEVEGTAIGLGGATYTSVTGPITFTGPVMLSTAVEPVVTGGGLAGDNIVFTGTIDGATNLTLDGGDADVRLNDTVGGSEPLFRLRIPAAHNVDLPEMIAGAFRQDSGIGVTTLNGPLSTTTIAGVSINNTTIAVNNSIDTSSAVAAPINLTAGTKIELGADLDSDEGQIDINGPAELTGDVAISTDAGAGSIRFASTLDDTGAAFTHNLTLTAVTGDVRFDGGVGQSVPLRSVTIVAANDVIAAAGFSVHDFDQQSGAGLTRFDGPVDIGGTPGLSISTADVTINNSITTSPAFPGPVLINHSGTLTIAADGDMDLAQPFPATTPAFEQDGSGPVFTGGDIQTAGATIIFNNPITLTGDVTFSTGAMPGGDIELAAVDGPHDLMLEAGSGDISLFGALGGGTELNDVTVNSAAEFSAGAISAASFAQLSGTGTATLDGAITTSGVSGISVNAAAIVVDASLIAGSGPISLVTDDLFVDANATLASTGSLTIAPLDPALAIIVGSGVGTSGELLVDSQTIATFQDGFSEITIGDAMAGTGRVDVLSSLFTDPITIVGGEISVTGLNAGANAATLIARVNSITNGGDLETDVTAGSVSLSADFGSIGSPTGPISLSATSLATSTAASGDQHLIEVDSVVWLSSAAGGGTINLVAGRFDIADGETINAGTVQVDAGAVLAGMGTVNAAVDVSGTVAPGFSPGVIDTGDVDFMDGSIFEVELAGTTPGNNPDNHDQLNVTGTVTIGMNVTLSVIVDPGFLPMPGDRFTIIANDAADAVSGEFAGLPEGGTFVNGMTTFTVTYIGGDGNDVELFVASSVSTPLLDPADDSGSSNSDGVTNVVTPRFTGTSDPLADVELVSSLDGVVGGTTADDTGFWSIVSSMLSDGNHSITARSGGQQSAPLLVTIDTSAPTPTISALQSSPTTADPINFTVDFGEFVDGFVETDLLVTNGTVSNFATIDGRNFTFDVSPLVSGTVTVEIISNVAMDLAGNSNFSASPFSIEKIDSLPGDTLVSCDVANILQITDISSGGKPDRLNISFDSDSDEIVIGDPDHVVVTTCGVSSGDHLVRVASSVFNGGLIEFDLLGGDDTLTIGNFAPLAATDIRFLDGDDDGNDTVTINGSVQLGGGSAEFDSENVLVFGDISTAGGSLSFVADLDLEIHGQVATVGGNLTFESRNRDIFMGPDTMLDAGSGDVTIVANTGVLLGQISTTGSVSIDAGLGGIADGNGDINDITAGVLNLSAGTSIGSKVTSGGREFVERIELAVQDGTIEVCADGLGAFLRIDGAANAVCSENPSAGIDAVNLAPPSNPAAVTQAMSLWQNPGNPLDVNNDWLVTPLDVLSVINELNERGARTLTHAALAFPSPVRFYDANGDGLSTPLDVLTVIDALNSARFASGVTAEAESIDQTAAVIVGILPPQETPAGNTVELATGFSAQRERAGSSQAPSRATFVAVRKAETRRNELVSGAADHGEMFDWSQAPDGWLTRPWERLIDEIAVEIAVSKSRLLPGPVGG